MKLRKANLTDFENFKILYEDLEKKYQIMYYDDSEDIDTVKQNDNVLEPMDEEEYNTWIRLHDEKYRNFTIDKFQAYLKEYRVYMVEDDGKLLGSLSVSKCGKTHMQIIDWGMFDTNTNIINKVIEQVKQKYHSQTILLIVCSEKMRKILFRNNFKEIASGIFEG